MKTSIVFQTPTALDIRALTVMGLSAKVNDNPIGFFGTGLKYAIAILKRTGHEITIISEGKTYFIETMNSEFRGKVFQSLQLHCFGNSIIELPFTTELGKTWELWQAYRELYCNTMDENGSVYKLRTNLTEINNDSTYIVVSGGSIESIHDSRTDFILDQNVAPYLDLGFIEIFDKPTKSIFYKGVKISTSDVEFVYTYNFHAFVDLTEDRTLKYVWQLYTFFTKILGLGLTSIEYLTYIKNILTIEKTFEHNIIKNGNVIIPNFAPTTVQFVQQLPARLKVFIPPKVRVVLNKQGAEIEVYEKLNLSPIYERALKEAIQFCKDIELPVDKYPILPVSIGDINLLGQADMDLKVIYITERAFVQGMKQLIGTLIEEFLHLEHNVYDGSRDMQNLLIDMIVYMGQQKLNRLV